MTQPGTRLRLQGNGWGLLAVMAAMWYVGAGQSNGAAYLLCFTVAGVALASIPHTWANLRGAQLHLGAVEPVFAGQDLTMRFSIEARPRGRHSSVSLAIPGAAYVQRLGIIDSEAPRGVEASLPAPVRGRFEGVRAGLQSGFPLGFFQARRMFELRQPYYVYPAPSGALPLPIASDPREGADFGIRAEGDDFAGVREWRAGESMRHVDWKAAARGHPLQVKQWDGAGSDVVCLAWERLPSLAREERLSQLAAWVLMAEQSGAAYSLQLPEAQIAPSRGENHMHQCLRALASLQPSPNGVPSRFRKPRFRFNTAAPND